MPRTLKQLEKIKDQRVQGIIKKRLKELEHDPGQQGKALGGELAGHRAVRAVGQRYRIIYRIEESRVIVHVVTVGLRKEGDRADVYAEAERLARRGELDAE